MNEEYDTKVKDNQEKLMETINGFRVDIAEIKSDIRHLVEQMSTLNASMNTISPLVQKHDIDIDSLKKEQEKMKDEIETLKTKVDALENENIKMNEQYAQTKTKTDTIIKVALGVGGTILLGVLALVLAKVGITI